MVTKADCHGTFFPHGETCTLLPTDSLISACQSGANVTMPRLWDTRHLGVGNFDNVLSSAAVVFEVRAGVNEHMPCQCRDHGCDVGGVCVERCGGSQIAMGESWPSKGSDGAASVDVFALDAVVNTLPLTHRTPQCHAPPPQHPVSSNTVARAELALLEPTSTPEPRGGACMQRSCASLCHPGRARVW